MNFADIVRQLSHGELSQLAIGKQIQASPTLENIGTLSDSVNLALTAIYKRFNLKEGRLTLRLFPDVPAYTLSDPTILKVERLRSEVGEAIPLNDSSDDWSCFTQSARVLRIPLALVNQLPSVPDKYKGSTIEVLFRAGHPQLDREELFSQGMGSVEMELPDTHLQALLYFVASRFHNPIGMSNEFHAGNSYYTKYEVECKRLEQENLEIDLGGTNTKLQRAGFK